MKSPHIGIHLTGIRMHDDGDVVRVHAGTVDFKADDAGVVHRGKLPSASTLGHLEIAPGAPEDVLGEGAWKWRRGVAPELRRLVQHAVLSRLAGRHHAFEQDGVLTLILHSLPAPELELELRDAGFSPMLAIWRGPASPSNRDLVARIVAQEPAPNAEPLGSRPRLESSGGPFASESQLHDAANHAWARFHALELWSAPPLLNVRRQTLTFGFEERGEIAWTMTLTLAPGRLTYPAVFSRGRNRIEVSAFAWRDFVHVPAIGKTLQTREATMRMAIALGADAPAPRPIRIRDTTVAESIFADAPGGATPDFSGLLATLRRRLPELGAGVDTSPVGRVRELLDDLAPPAVTPATFRSWLEDQGWFDAADYLERHASESVERFMDGLWDRLLDQSIKTTRIERDGSDFIVACSALSGDGPTATVLRLTVGDEGPELTRIAVQVLDDCDQGRCRVRAPSDAFRGDEELCNLRRHAPEQLFALRSNLRGLAAGLRRAPAALAELREALTLAAVLVESPRCQGDEREAARESLQRAKHFYDAARELYADGRKAASLQHVYEATQRVAAAAAEASLLCAEGVRDLPYKAAAQPPEALDTTAEVEIVTPTPPGDEVAVREGDPSDVFMYQAALCGWCGRSIRRELTATGKAPENPDDEHSYDSDEFPKGPYRPSEADTPQHCAVGEECLAAESVRTGEGELRVGRFLENPLTADGYAYVEEAVREGKPVPLQIWAPFYRVREDALDGDVADEARDDAGPAQVVEEHLRRMSRNATSACPPPSPERRPVRLDLRGLGFRTRQMLLRDLARSSR